MLGGAAAPPLAELTARCEAERDLMLRGYTMTDERTIHHRVLGRPADPAPMQTPSAIDDLLF